MTSERLGIPEVRLGIVGCEAARRRIGAGPRSIQGLQITALYDSDVMAARAWARELGRPPVYSDYGRFLKEAPLDAVFIASSAETRAALSIAAVRSGRAVFSDIPLANSLEECDALQQSATERGVVVMPAFWKRFDTRLIRATELIQQGRIGEVARVRCHWTVPTRDGKVPSFADSEFEFVLEYAGQMVDLCRWWLGAVETVSAHIETASISHRADLILNHTRGVSIHHVTGNMQGGGEERYIIDGSGGALEIDMERAGPYSASARSGLLLLRQRDRTPEEIPFHGFHGAEDEVEGACGRRALEQFVQALHMGVEPEMTVSDGRNAIEVISAAYLSTRQNTKVSLPLLHYPDVRV